MGKKVNLHLPLPSLTVVWYHLLTMTSTPPPADFPQPPLTNLLPPLLATDLQTVSIGSVVAALAELNLEALTEGFLKVIHHQEEARLVSRPLK